MREGGGHIFARVVTTPQSIRVLAKLREKANGGRHPRPAQPVLILPCDKKMTPFPVRGRE